MDRRLIRSLSVAAAARRAIARRALVLGFAAANICTVAVAWGIAIGYWPNHDSRFEGEKVLADGRSVRYGCSSGFGSEFYVWGIDPPYDQASRDAAAELFPVRYGRRDPTWGPLLEAWRGELGGTPVSASQRRIGLPFRCMAMWSETVPGGTRQHSWTAGRAWLAEWRGWHSPLAGIPLRPTWLTFAANVLVYWLLVQFLIFVAFFLNSQRRIHRGRCPLCNYEMADRLLSDGCPECGWRRAGTTGGVART